MNSKQKQNKKSDEKLYVIAYGKISSLGFFSRYTVFLQTYSMWMCVWFVYFNIDFFLNFTQKNVQTEMDLQLHTMGTGDGGKDKQGVFAFK